MLSAETERTRVAAGAKELNINDSQETSEDEPRMQLLMFDGAHSLDDIEEKDSIEASDGSRREIKNNKVTKISERWPERAPDLMASEKRQVQQSYYGPGSLVGDSSDLELLHARRLRRREENWQPGVKYEAAVAQHRPQPRQQKPRQFSSNSRLLGSQSPLNANARQQMPSRAKAKKIQFVAVVDRIGHSERQRRQKILKKQLQSQQQQQQQQQQKHQLEHFKIGADYRIQTVSRAATNFWPLALVAIIALAQSMPVAESVDCFKCSSRNGSNPACEDPFHNLNTTRVISPILPDPVPQVVYHAPCYAGKKGRDGLFPASACIKLTGIFDTTGETLIVRHCALDSGTLTQDTELARMSHCGKFQFEGDLLRGCVLACPEDACNSAITLTGSSSLAPLIGALLFGLMVTLANTRALVW